MQVNRLVFDGEGRGKNGILPQMGGFPKPLPRFYWEKGRINGLCEVIMEDFILTYP